MCHDIYISFGGDQRPFVDKLTNALEKLGLTVQHEDAAFRSPGSAAALYDVSAYCSCTIACWSSSSVGCNEVNAEADEAHASRALTQIIVSPCVPPKQFAGLDAPDLSSWDGELDHLGFLDLLQNIAETQFGECYDDLPLEAITRAQEERRPAGTICGTC